jgi:YidC/Oxa1 family membrane protein insertase
VAQLWGAILNGFGYALEYIYRVVPSYGFALIMLTLVSRAVIAPLGVKQIRSMQKMQKLQPELKKIQQKYKGDRQKLNEEMMKLYKEHGANPLGGCLPVVAQFPVFFALYAVIRATLPGVAAVPATSVTFSSFTRTAICRPDVHSHVNGSPPATVVCDANGTSTPYAIKEWRAVDKKTVTNTAVTPPSYLSTCTAGADASGNLIFVCHPPYGTGHLPKDGKLFKTVVEDRDTFLGMHLACSPRQASNADQAKLCTASGKKATGAGVVAYYLLVVLMAGSTFYQQKQMQARQPSGQQAQQMKMMMTVMPVLFGYLSLQFPAALSIYWVTGNVWTIVQQHLIFRKEEPPAPAPKEKKGKR